MKKLGKKNDGVNPSRERWLTWPQSRCGGNRIKA